MLPCDIRNEFRVEDNYKNIVFTSSLTLPFRRQNSTRTGIVCAFSPSSGGIEGQSSRNRRRRSSRSHLVWVALFRGPTPLRAACYKHLCSLVICAVQLHFLSWYVPGMYVTPFYSNFTAITLAIAIHDYACKPCKLHAFITNERGKLHFHNHRKLICFWINYILPKPPILFVAVVPLNAFILGINMLIYLLLHHYKELWWKRGKSEYSLQSPLLSLLRTTKRHFSYYLLHIKLRSTVK